MTNVKMIEVLKGILQVYPLSHYAGDPNIECAEALKMAIAKLEVLVLFETVKP